MELLEFSGGSEKGRKDRKMTKMNQSKLYEIEQSFLAAKAVEKENEKSITDWSWGLIQSIGKTEANKIIREKQKEIIKEELKRIKSEYDKTKRPMVICSDDLVKMIKNRFYRGISVPGRWIVGINTANSICRETNWLVSYSTVEKGLDKYHLFSNLLFSGKEMKKIWTDNKHVVDKRTPPWEMIYED